MVAGRDADRVLRQPGPEPRPRGAARDLRRGRRHGRGLADRLRLGLALLRRRPGRTTARRSSHSGTASRGPATGRGSGASPPTARSAQGGGHRPARPQRAQARRRDEQRHHARRGPAARPDRGRQGRAVHGARRRLVRAVARRAGRHRRARAAHDGRALPVGLGRRPRVRGAATASPRSARPARRCPRWSRSTWRRAARRVRSAPSAA